MVPTCAQTSINRIAIATTARHLLDQESLDVKVFIRGIVEQEHIVPVATNEEAFTTLLIQSNELTRSLIKTYSDLS